MESLDNRGIYEDLLREFSKQHNVYVISPVERRYQRDTVLHKSDNVQILELKTGNIQKTNIIEKGISTLLIEHQFISAIKKYFSQVKFDFILYSTPPITLAGVVEYVKKRDNAKTYLMLKDIFPQNAVDIGMMSKTGVKGILYRYFRGKEKKLYSFSDKIGCMSQANVDYVIKNNPEISTDKMEICPNSLEICDMRTDEETRILIRNKYDIPLDKKVFVYGGNLGKPQGIEFIIDCLKSQENSEDVYFLIVGDGTEFGKLEAYFNETNTENMRLMKRLPKEDYDRMIAACDVGMIFLDHRFTIPNFPSRLLAYMQAGLPVLACTDPNTDVGKVITEGKFGWWCESNDVEEFSRLIEKISVSDLSEYKNNSWKCVCDFYNVSNVYLKCFVPFLN